MKVTMNLPSNKIDRTDEYLEMDIEDRVNAMMPSIVVDFAMGALFFFVAQRFGLVTAAVTGAAATFFLIFVVQRFITTDISGGLAKFGMAMALISAALALIFQDDTFVKLRGSLMGLIGAGACLIDGFRGGSYIGKRLALYLGALGNIPPRRASFAMAGAGLTLMAIELPLIWLLTTDQWIWYNSWFDNLVAMPVVLGAMWFARVPEPDSDDDDTEPDAATEPLQAAIETPQAATSTLPQVQTAETDQATLDTSEPA